MIGQAIPECDILLGVALWLKSHRGVLPYRLSVARGAGIIHRIEQERISRVLREDGVPPPLLDFYPDGPDYVGVSRTEWWQIECKGSGLGKVQTLRNNFDRALASVVSFFSADVLRAFRGNPGIRAFLGLALADHPAYARLVSQRISSDLQTALNLWVLLIGPGGDVTHVLAPEGAAGAERDSAPAAPVANASNVDADTSYRSATWKEAVLKALREEGGESVSLRAIYNHMAAASLVTTYHLEPWRPGGQPRFECWTRRTLTDLARAGAVRRVGRSTYSIAANGLTSG